MTRQRSSTPAFAMGLLLVFFLTNACNTLKYLDEEKNERLLVKNTLKLNSTVSGKRELLYGMESLYKQEPNSRALYLFRYKLWTYYRKKDKDSKFAKFLMKRLAEKPTIYNDNLTQKTAKNFENYMKLRGYFDAKCLYETKYIGDKKAKVAYTLDLGLPYTVDKVSFVSRDSNVQRILRETAKDTKINPGSILNGPTFDLEKARITTELKNRGYAYFVQNFVEFNGDSTGHKSNVSVEVLPQNDTLPHQTYTIGKVAVFNNLVPDYNSIRRDTVIEGIYFASSDPSFMLKPSRMYNAIVVRPGMPFRQSDFDQTYRNLNALGVFRFVSIKPVQDTLNPARLNVTISFAPNKRLSSGGDVEINGSNGSAINGAENSFLLGTSVSTTFRNRNLFKGAEHLQTKLGYHVEFDIGNSQNRLNNSKELKIENDLTLPRFVDYFGLWRTVNRFSTKKASTQPNNFYKRLKMDAQSRFALSYNYLDQFSIYTYNLFHAAYGYNLRTKTQNQFSFDHIGIDVLQPTLKDSIFVSNEFRRRSFSDQLFTGFLLRSFSYSYAGSNNHFGERWSFRIGTEVSGVEEMIAHNLWELAFGPEPNWKIGSGDRGLDFSKYLLLDLNGTYTRDFNRKTTGVVRIGAGIVRQFGDSESTPYVKQFFVGGPNSIRAWRIREIGPGSYVDKTFDTVSQKYQLTARRPPYYQTADFRFEFNGELRFNIWWILKGAFFLDGGNVWGIGKQNDAQPGANLRWDSYKDIALGTGFGLRVDITYAVIRFDLGLKLRNPYQLNNESQWRVSDWNKKDFNFNLAVGYPF